MASVALFVGGIRPLPQSGRPTGMYKAPVTQPVALTAAGFVGDVQADRRVHGGPDKAVHLYPARHYAVLAEAFPQVEDQLVPGSLGENISSAEIDENDVHIGDIWSLGTARLQVCQPRSPCWKIDERFGTEGMAAFIAQHRLTGWYWRVLTVGQISPADRLVRERAAEQAFTIAEALELCAMHRPALGDLESLAAAAGIAENWRRKIHQRIAWLRQQA